ncbi:hypothetical protein [Enterobacter asburiae]|uniref:hypothetical protein n=1 Tax=Enterobacter asburiae TaxID=61645 RepID=UPI003B2307A6
MNAKNNEAKVVDTKDTIAKELTCFVIMPIADTAGYEPSHFDRVYKHLIQPACIKANFKAVRADEISNTNFIVLDILRRIVESDIAICDLSSRNPNVMYELGLRQAFNKKTVLIKDEKTTNPFDVQGFRYCSYDSALRIDNAFDNVNSIAKALSSTHEADSFEVNSIVQLLKIEPAQIGDKTQLSDQNTIILEAIKELANRIEKPVQSAPKFTVNKDYKREYRNSGQTSIGETFKFQNENYDPKSLLNNYYTLDGKGFGLYKGIGVTEEGKFAHAFDENKLRKFIELNDPILDKIVEDIPF